MRWRLQDGLRLDCFVQFIDEQALVPFGGGMMDEPGQISAPFGIGGHPAHHNSRCDVYTKTRVCYTTYLLYNTATGDM